jgi:hypothetical protein
MSFWVKRLMIRSASISAPACERLADFVHHFVARVLAGQSGYWRIISSHIAQQPPFFVHPLDLARVAQLFKLVRPDVDRIALGSPREFGNAPGMLQKIRLSQLVA